MEGKDTRSGGDSFKFDLDGSTFISASSGLASLVSAMYVFDGGMIGADISMGVSDSGSFSVSSAISESSGDEGIGRGVGI